jgi:hypothetical protein
MRSSTNLRERVQAADPHLQQRVLERLVRERGTKRRLERLARSQRLAQVDFMVTEQAGA